jgi:DNA-binding beta-propeller fold protein YncE
MATPTIPRPDATDPGDDFIDPIDSGEGYLGFGRPMPLGVDDADFRFRQRRADLLRGWGLSFRHHAGGQLPPWYLKISDDDIRKEARKALRYIAAGFAVFAEDAEEEDPLAFRGTDWALFSGLDQQQPKQAHQDTFVSLVDSYIQQSVRVYEEVGTGGIPGKNGGDYDFVLRDIVALIHTFIGYPKLLTNAMVRRLLSHDKVTFTDPDGSCQPTGEVPFSGQDLDRWLFAGNNNGHNHYVFDTSVSPLIALGISTPETENHLLLIYSWRYLVNEYLEWVAGLPAGHDRYDACLKALVRAHPEQYVNNRAMRDFVLQQLGRIVHSGSFEANAKPYQSITISAALAFYQAAGVLFPDDAARQRVAIAAKSALDYFAAEYAFQSFEGKRIPPSRRQYKKMWQLALYDSDYLANIFGILTGAYVYEDTNGASDVPDGSPDWAACAPETFNEPCWALRYHWNNLDENGGYALWAVLSGYRVPRPVHHLMLNKHAGYLARINPRYSSNAYPLNITYVAPHFGDPDVPEPARPRYFQQVASGEVPVDQYDVAAGGDFRPVTQVYFATDGYLSSAGGQCVAYYEDLLNYLDPVIDLLPDNVVEKLRSYDTLSRPTVLLPRGNIQLRETVYSGAFPLMQTAPVMVGQKYPVSENLSSYKSLSLGYWFSGHDDDHHLQWPQHYPDWWNEAIAEEFGIDRAVFRVFDFVSRPDHPLAGHYLVMARFSKSYNDGLYRSYARGLWEVVPAHRFPDAAALAQHLRDTNPAIWFNDDKDDNYQYRMVTTGEIVVIDKLMGSSKTAQSLLRIWGTNGLEIPINRYLADMRDRPALRDLPLMDVWQVDRDYGFTGEKYAFADGHGRVTVHNPFLGESLLIDSSDYRRPSNVVVASGVRRQPLPALGTGPSEVLALAVDGRHIYATHSVADGPGEVVALDRYTLQAGKRVTVGRSPHRLAFDSAARRLYAVNYHDISVSVIDSDTFAVVATLTFPGFALTGVAVSSRFHRAYAVQPGQERVLVIDGSSLAVGPHMTGLQPTGDIAIDEATDRLYLLVKNATNPAWQDLVEYRITETGQEELRRITVDGQVSVVPALAVDARSVYILNRGAGGGSSGQKVTVVDRASFTLRGPLALEHMGLAVAASSSQKVFYVGTSSEVRTYDATHLQLLRRTPLPSGQLKVSLGVHEPSGLVFFSGSGNDTVSALEHPWLGY